MRLVNVVVTPPRRKGLWALQIDFEDGVLATTRILHNLFQILQTLMIDADEMEL